MKRKFGTALNCIDGRTQVPVTKWIKKIFRVDYVDLITEPGVDKVLSQGRCTEIVRLKEKAIISVNAHNSNVIAVVGHYDCAANPVSELEHFRNIIASTYEVESWGLPVKVVGLWVDESFSVHVIKICQSNSK